MSLVTFVEQEVGTERTPAHLESCIPLHAGLFALLAFVGIAIQCGYILGDADPAKAQSVSRAGSGSSAADLRTGRSLSGGLRVDEEMELKVGTSPCAIFC
jgi:hypothetical protein